MAFRIIHIVSAGAEKRLEVFSGLLSIGRGALNDLQLDSLAIPLSQAEIRRNEEGSFVLRDLADGHIMYLNGAPVKEAILQSGDVIKIESYYLSVSQDDPSGPLVLSVEEAPVISSEPSLALMPKLLLVGGRWTKWRIAVSLVVVLSIAGALAGAWSQGGVLMPGAVSVKHTKFEAECETCHASAKPVWKFVDDAACQACHNTEILSPTHFKDGVALSDVPACASCHLEHKGTHGLSDITDGKCVQCHGDLRAKEPKVGDLTGVHNFSTDHPEFAVTQAEVNGQGKMRVRLNDTERLKDGGRLKLNHSVHLKLGDKVLDSFNRTPLICSDCHHVDDEGRYMRPVSFNRDCFSCHRNEFDLAPLVPGESVTHGRQLKALRKELDQLFAIAYQKEHPEEAKKPEPLRWIPGRRLPGQPLTPQQQRMEEKRIVAEERLLSTKQKMCLKCHDLGKITADVSGEAGEGGIPASIPDTTVTQEAAESSGRLQQVEIAEVNVPVRWLPYNRFDHRAHAPIPELGKTGQGNWCVPCHKNALTSIKTDDVLLPSIVVCRSCHHEEAGGASAGCKSCHEFHVPKLKPPSIQPLTRVSSHVERSLSSRGEEFVYV